MNRIQNWPTILANEIALASTDLFEWGKHDCCSFAARIVYAITSKNFMNSFPPYCTEEEAGVILGTNGGVEGIATQCLGDPVPVMYAQRGDVLLLLPVGSTNGESLGICIDHRGAFASAKGLIKYPVAGCKLAWRV